MRILRRCKRNKLVYVTFNTRKDVMHGLMDVVVGVRVAVDVPMYC